MLAQIKVMPFDVNKLKTACSTCSLHELCLPAGLNQHELEIFDQLPNHRRPVKRGDYLYRSGADLYSLYAIRTGFMKSSVLHEDGREQVAGFHMMGDLMGLDAISSNRHTCDTVALEDSDVCEIPFTSLEKLSREIPSLQHHFHRVMSREIVRDHGVMLLLGSMRAEERLAAFLLNLSQRFAARGYSPVEFNLRMTREEIGSYLGLKLETISRVLSRFQEDRLIDVKNKNIKINSLDKLRALIGESDQKL
ncbi:MAG TPA: fumarate/nitrate reduction transcriptional regulator Fnr [Burkholderiales bacterium]|nr:fumarate/nitrate reduction transcriptional regulator Fnr [Burkholderiales bacterium]